MNKSILFGFALMVLGSGVQPARGDDLPCKEIIDGYRSLCDKRWKGFWRKVETTLLPTFEIERTTDYPELYAMVEELAAELNLTMPRVKVYKGSVPSHILSFGHDPMTINAYVDPRGDVHVGTELIEALSRDELRAVLAHELGHVDKKHILKRIGAMAVSLPVFLAVYYAGIALKLQNKHTVGATVIVSGYLGWQAFLASISRKHEFEADEVSFRVTGDEGALIRALDKIENIVQKMHPILYYIGKVEHALLPFLRSHPTNRQRESRLKRLTHMDVAAAA